MQCTQFRAKSAKNNLKPTYFLRRNFYFETEGVSTWLYSTLTLATSNYFAYSLISSLA
jgi:hypothetical protein